MIKNKEAQDIKKSEEQKGYMMNLTSKILDNIQVSIKNIHIRFEDANNYELPLSMGLTMEKLEIETTNEKWEREFFDRTNPLNKFKPLQKIIKLNNLGFYCNPKDTEARCISKIKIMEQKLATFQKMFPVDSTMSLEYEHSYVSTPVSSVTKLKQLSEHAISSATEPIYTISVEINEININILKS